MKILQIIPMLGMGGAETMCETLTNELVKLNNNVIVVSLYSEKTVITERLISQGIEVVSLDKKLGFDLSCIKRLRKLIKQIKPDVIHTHLYAVKYAILATIGKKIKIVHTIHNIAQKEAGKKDRLFNGFFFKTGKVIPVALSENVKDSILKEYKLHDAPVILNGVDLSKCIKKETYEIGDKFKIINIARFSEQKKHARLIAAFNLFVKDHPNSELRLVGDGELRKDIELLVKQYQLRDKVKFLGLQNNIYPFLHDADCFVLSSDYEGIPLTLIEAMGTGLPIISTNVGGIPDMIKDGEEGLLCELDFNDIEKNMNNFYKNKTLRELCGKNALKKSIKFGAKTMANNYLRIYVGNKNDD